MGFAPAKRRAALALVAGLLHLGDVEFSEAEDGARGGGGDQTTSVVNDAAVADGDALSRAAGLMGVEAAALGDALTQRRIEVLDSCCHVARTPRLLPPLTTRK